MADERKKSFYLPREVIEEMDIEATRLGCSLSRIAQQAWKESKKMGEDQRTIGDLAREALDVQDACNLSGVVHSWSRSIKRLRELCPTAGTEQINKSPINKLWADKVAHLTGTQSFNAPDVSDAYAVVKVLANGG